MIISEIFLILGSFIILISTIGIYKFRDIFAKIHANALAETLGLILIIIGVSINSSFQNIIKLIMLMIILLITNPTITHILARTILNSALTKKSDE